MTLRGVRAGVKQARAHGKALVDKGIHVGDWLAVQARIQEKDKYNYWVCRATSVAQYSEATAASEGCILESVDTRKTIITTCFSPGDTCIAVSSTSETQLMQQARPF